MDEKTKQRRKEILERARKEYRHSEVYRIAKAKGDSLLSMSDLLNGQEENEEETNL